MHEMREGGGNPGLPCINPVCPCAMTGAAACLAGFEGIGVIVHGSSGCYFYPATLIPARIYGTMLIEEEIIFGTEERLCEVITDLKPGHACIAVLNTCVPAVLGEDISCLQEEGIMVIDSPGFKGSFEVGYIKALGALAPEPSPGAAGVNIDGVNIADPFHRGDAQEAGRLLSASGAETGTIFCNDRYEMIKRAGAWTIGTNPDLKSGVGTWCGDLLGLSVTGETFRRLSDRCAGIDPEPVSEECRRAEERIVKACDKYLRRFDPPCAAIFSGFSRAVAIADHLKTYLDADIAVIGSRNAIRQSGYRVEETTGLDQMEELIRETAPDLIIGSSYERRLMPGAAFVGATPPLRGRVHLHSRPIAGVEGALCLTEDVLNACMDRHNKRH